MNLVTLNVRGLGEKHKAEWACRLRRSHNLVLMAIQETQLSDLHNSLDVSSCWGNFNHGFEYVNATGRSGGLLTIWDSNFFNIEATVKSMYFLMIIGTCTSIDGQVVIVNVYGPKSSPDKLQLWWDLLNLKQQRMATWIILGDFNEVRSPDERINSTFCKSSTECFNHFIQRAELHDLKMWGFRFTYFQQYGAKLSKLDRILVCEKFMIHFPLASSTALPKEISDHSPVILKTEVVDFGPPPFMLFNSWMMRDGFEQIVIKA
ncbi:uncharacterized protein LOC111910084 [Lactuca sativa]|uniref:uncharacterized protein LOC111910084 n=1 Tax=Lactuca sativa TaxID=4236 RepID=UPI000CD9F5AF|nr:uncharacterized protein LOC111910084 [Lactuca sativa]